MSDIDLVIPGYDAAKANTAKNTMNLDGDLYYRLSVIIFEALAQALGENRPSRSEVNILREEYSFAWNTYKNIDVDWLRTAIENNGESKTTTSFGNRLDDVKKLFKMNPTSITARAADLQALMVEINASFPNNP